MVIERATSTALSFCMYKAKDGGNDEKGFLFGDSADDDDGGIGTSECHRLHWGLQAGLY